LSDLGEDVPAQNSQTRNNGDGEPHAGQLIYCGNELHGDLTIPAGGDLI
jgi:hypothetical protein